MRRLLPMIAATMLAACATAPAPEPAFVPVIAPERMVAAIRAAAGNADSELTVQPLRDPRVEDLRQQALLLEGGREYHAAATALDQALAITPDDPALLQERAEAALLLRDFDTAETLALRAHRLGAKVGPLCRRHWATAKSVREQRVQAASVRAGMAKGAEQSARLSMQVATLAAAVAEADGEMLSCKVAGPNRF